MSQGFDVTARIDLEIDAVRVGALRHVAGMAKELEAKVADAIAKLPPLGEQAFEEMIQRRVRIEYEREIERVVGVIAKARAAELVAALPQFKETGWRTP
jgi:hypothetical protein